MSEFKEGDKVILKNSNNCLPPDKVGSIAEIISHDRFGFLPYEIIFDDTEGTWWVEESQVQPLSDS